MGNALDHPEAAVKTEVQTQAGGRATLTLEGRLNVYTAGACWREVERRLHNVKTSLLEVDVSRLELEGGIGIALLRYLCEGRMTPGARVSLRGLQEGAQKLLDTFTGEDLRAYTPRPGAKLSFPAEVGVTTRGVLHDLREQIEFIGSVARALPLAIVRPRRMRWPEVWRMMETAGANALPVVGAVSWLVGLVLALEAARPLQQLGAQIMAADMIGFAAIRDTGPLITAVMLAGRSASAFAAELGTMKVNQELDALTTMGLEPVRFLVVQRVVAAFLLTPLLALYAMLLSIIGGVIVLRLMGFPPLMIFHEIFSRVDLRDLGVGLTKSLIFGLIVGAVGCQRGLQTAQGPQAVGHSTTRAVVASIILVIFANTIYSAANYFLSSPL